MIERDQPQSELSKEARAFGIDPEKLSCRNNWGGVWPEHVKAVAAFVMVQSQMRVVAVGMSNKVLAMGLDYAGAQAGLELAGIEVTPVLWGQIQLIEAGAKNALNEAAA